MPKVQVYSKQQCAYCVRAKALLTKKGIPFEEIDVEQDEAKRTWLVEASGQRTVPQIFVDGRPLGEHYQVKRFTRFGFEWTYEGDSPQQLALAILADYFGDNARAIRLAEPFMKQIVANLDNDWQLSGAEVDAAVRSIEGG